MFAADMSSEFSESKSAGRPCVLPPDVDGSERRMRDAMHCCESSPCSCARRADRLRLSPSPGLDQARLGEEPQPMLPGLERC